MNNINEGLDISSKISKSDAIINDYNESSNNVQIIQESLSVLKPLLLSKNNFLKLSEPEGKELCNFVSSNSVFRANFFDQPHYHKILTRSSAFHAFVTPSRISNAEIVKVVHEKSHESTSLRDFEGAVVSIAFNRRDFLAILDNSVDLYIFSIKFTDSVLYDIVYKKRMDFVIDPVLNVIWCDSLTLFTLALWRGDQVLVHDIVADSGKYQVVSQNIPGFNLAGEMNIKIACVCISRDSSKLVVYCSDKRLRLFKRCDDSSFNHTDTIDASMYSSIKNLFFYNSIDLRPLTFVALFHDRIKFFDFGSLEPISDIFFDYQNDFVFSSSGVSDVLALIDRKNLNLIVIKLLDEEHHHIPSSLFLFPLNTKTIAFCVDESKFSDHGSIDILDLSTIGMHHHIVVLNEKKEVSMQIPSLIESQNNYKVPVLISTKVNPLPKKKSNDPIKKNTKFHENFKKQTNIRFTKPIVNSDPSTDYEDNLESNNNSFQRNNGDPISSLRRYMDQAFTASNRNFESFINKHFSQYASQGGKNTNFINKRFDSFEIRLKCLEENMIRILKKIEENNRQKSCDCSNLFKKELQNVQNSLSEISSKINHINRTSNNFSSSETLNVENFAKTLSKEIKSDIDKSINQKLIPIYRSELTQLMETVNSKFQSGTLKYLSSIGEYFDKITDQISCSNKNTNAKTQELMTNLMNDILNHIKDYLDVQSKIITDKIIQQHFESFEGSLYNRKSNNNTNLLEKYIKNRDCSNALKICIEDSDFDFSISRLLNNVSPNELFSKNQTNIQAVIKFIEITSNNFLINGVDFDLMCEHLTEAAFLLRLNRNILEHSFKKILERLKKKINDYKMSYDVNNSSSFSILFKVMDALINDLQYL